MRWILALALFLAAPALAQDDPLAHVPGWVLLTTPGRTAYQAVALLRQAQELESTAPLLSISRRLEELRGLKFFYPVRFTVKTPQGVRAFLEEEIATSYPAKRMHRDEVQLQQLGLVPEGFELKPFLLDLLEEQIAGAYDPEKDYFFIVIKPTNWLSKALESKEQQSIITLHELDHAMQNQHFDLRKTQDELAQKANGDRELAFSALVEGDATSVMYDLALAPQGMTSPEYPVPMESLTGLMTALPMPGMGKFQKAPLYFQRSLMFPYMTGCDFVNAHRRQGGWEAVNAIYTDLPVSSEQILHPERYWTGDEPLPLELKLPLPGWKALGQDTGGEFTLRVFLEQHGVANFKAAAEGWGNDRLAVYEKANQACLVWLTRWDDESEAEEFARAAREAHAPGRWTVDRQGDRVLLTRDVPKELLGRVRKSLKTPATTPLEAGPRG